VAKILVVNEDAGLFERIQTRFQAEEPGFEVFAAISGPRAIGIAQQRNPDVIIVDGDMVGLDGYALTQQLKADPELASVPVIILADEPSETSSLKARQAGAAAHLPESVDLGTLLDKVRVLAGVAITASSTSPEAP
jgi:CheY-like chemotaxis protein